MGGCGGDLAPSKSVLQSGSCSALHHHKRAPNELQKTDSPVHHTPNVFLTVCKSSLIGMGIIYGVGRPGTVT